MNNTNNRNNTANTNHTKNIDLRDLTRAQLSELLLSIDLPPERAPQIFSQLQRPGLHNIEQLELKRDIREHLGAHVRLSRLRIKEVESSADGTRKYILRLEDGLLIESVLIPGHGRYTLCLSSQAGCAMGCRFCLTAGLGFRRNLRPAEITGQVLAVMEDMLRRKMGNGRPRELINNLVFMGMGEPLANYDHLLTALHILMDQQGLEFTRRRITISTCGLIPALKRLPGAVKVNLAVSLHAADNDLRDQLMPINRRHPLDDLLAACRAYPLPRKGIILFAYLMLKGINDQPAAARALSKKLTGIPCRVNLLPFNESRELPYKRPDKETINEFKAILQQAGYTTIIRDSRGGDISAACGQLALRESKTKA
ncbi:MAG TPA: 23S rRNA (adenine(2503)-C(2))-methyltransferase RlmN [Desulfobacterales bacterium]|nr:23S rRNA (adenine(2503)-C(2))-methyltransferase RlmN [Desulfobacterales bacterium]